MTNYKIIFVDIDWTILSHKDGRQFDIPSIEALIEAQKQGIKVFICTSRPYHSVDQIGLFHLFKPDGMIVCNGGLIIYNDKIINEKVMDQDIFEKICYVVIINNVNLEGVEPFHRFLLKEENEDVRSVYDTFPEIVPDVEDYHNRHIISTLLFAPEYLDEKLKQELPSGLFYYRFHPYGVDLLQYEHTKGEGVEFVLSYLKLDKKSAIAFGDDTADISMFNNVGTSIALLNGKDEVKEAATFVTDEVWNSGVKKALIKLGIVK